MALRSWCSQCGSVVSGDATAFAGEHRGHVIRPIGADVQVEVVVADRRHDLDIERFGFRNNVGHEAGRSAVQQERYTRKRIEDLRKRAIQMQRQRKVTIQGSSQGEVVGAFPSALLFSLRKQYGAGYMEKAKELAQRQGLWWGR